MSKISVIVPIYNALDALKVLLASLLKNFNFELGEILLINDYSNQETSEYLTQFVNEHSKFKLFNNEKNLGFVKTCNKGMQLASGDIIVLLNSDTEIPSNFCEQIIKCFESDSKIGIASPISSHSWLFYIPLPKNYSLEKMNSKLRQKHKCSYPLIHAAEGFCFCIRKKVIEKQGYLDEIYGKGYKEEVDFAYRAISNGWKNVLIDNLYVYHKRHASFGVEQREILLKQNDTVYRQRWKGFKENYEKENNLINPVIKIEQEMFPFRTFFFKKKIKKGCSYNFFEELFSIKNSKDKRHKIISILGIKLSLANQKPKILVHLHLYYYNQIDFWIDKFSNINHCDWDLFVTYVDENEKSKNKILKIKPDTKFIKVKNAGYDILPFLKIIENVNLSEYDYILKMHTKNYRAKPYIGVGYDWRNLLVSAILDSPKRFCTCLKIFTTKKNIGMICAKECILDMNNRNAPEDSYLYDKICADWNLPNNKGLFCAGTMFMCRASLMKWCQDIPKDFIEISQVEKTGQNGGTIHVLERLFSTMITNQQYLLYGIANHRYLLCKKIKKIIQTIFSIKNSYEKKHKIITILGIKIKIRKSPRSN